MASTSAHAKDVASAVTAGARVRLHERRHTVDTKLQSVSFMPCEACVQHDIDVVVFRLALYIKRLSIGCSTCCGACRTASHKGRHAAAQLFS